MRKLALGLSTAALLTAAAVAPAMAQVGFYAGPFGVASEAARRPITTAATTAIRAATTTITADLTSWSAAAGVLAGTVAGMVATPPTSITANG